MSLVLEVSEEGSLTLPAEVIGHAQPHTRFAVVSSGAAVVLQQEDEKLPFWMTATPAQRAERFLQWMASHRDQAARAPLPDEALRRESIYE
jgi:hypothetical protein